MTTEPPAYPLSGWGLLRARSAPSAMGHGGGLDLNGYAACCRWLGVSLDTFVGRAHATSATESLAAELTSLLQRHGVPEAYWRGALCELIDCLAARSETKQRVSTR